MQLDDLLIELHGPFICTEPVATTTGLLGYLGVQFQGKRSRGDFMNLLVIKLFHNSQFRLVPWLGQQGSDAKTKSGRLIKHMTLDLSKGNDENAWLRFRTQTCTCV